MNEELEKENPERSAAHAGEDSAAAAEPSFPPPPATFEFLVESLVFQAQMALGLFAFAEKEPKPDLGRARHAIDMLGVLQEKTRGNLTIEEQRLLENSLTELRFRFLTAAGKG